MLAGEKGGKMSFPVAPWQEYYGTESKSGFRTLPFQCFNSAALRELFCNNIVSLQSYISKLQSEMAGKMKAGK